MYRRWTSYWPLLILAVFVAAGTWYWWINRPDYMLGSAQKAFDRGNEARDRGDTAAAKTYYESADQHLVKLLDKDKLPNHVGGLMLRSRVLSQLSLLYLAEEKAAERQGNPIEQRRSTQLFPEIWESIDRAASLDSRNAEAHGKLMMNLLFHEQIARAYPHASRLVRLEPGQNSDGPWPSYYGDQSTAQWVLAWYAIHQYKPPRPVEALDHLRRSEEFESKALADQDKKPLPPRWRAVAIEAHSLALLVEQAKQIGSIGGRDPSQDVRLQLDRLREKLTSWLARIKAELADPLPSVPVQLPNHVHTIASMAARSSPTDLPGLLDVLQISIQYAADPVQAIQRAELAATVGAKLTSAPQTPDLVLREVCRRLPLMVETVQRRTQHLVQN